jgi:hypothetical protein
MFMPTETFFIAMVMRTAGASLSVLRSRITLWARLSRPLKKESRMRRARRTTEIDGSHVL